MANNIFKELEKGSLPGLKRCISLFPSSVNAKNSAGATPLHVAASQGLASFVKELLVHGAPHDITDGQGNLPLHLASEQGSLESVAELLTGPGRKLVVKAKNREGLTPLHLAVRNGHSAVVAKLLDAGARTDAKDKAGVTPLELVSAEDEEMLQLLLDGTPTHSLGSMSQGFGTAGAHSARSLEASQSLSRQPALGSVTPSTTASAASGRFMTPPPLSGLGAIGSSRIAAGTPSTPPSRGAAQGPGTAGRGAHGSSGIGTPGPVTNRGSTVLTPGGGSSRLPRNMNAAAAQPAAATTPVAAAAPAAVAAAGGGAVGASSVNAQFQKQDAAIQALKAGLRTATERLGAVDACAAAQLECAAQVEKALEACGSNSRALADLEARVGFQEERGRDARTRLERLEEGERSLQVSVSRLTDDHHGVAAQLQKLTDQVAAGTAGAAQQQAAASTSQTHQQLQMDLVSLKAQVDQLAPAFMVATAASAEVRALASRLDTLQQQVQQQAAQSAAQQHQQMQAAPPATLGSNLILDQQVLQLQAQVQLLQLPVASLTQQCGDLTARLSSLAEQQQQARTDMAKLAEAQASQAGGAKIGGELSDAVMRVLDTTARTMAELRQQQDDTAKQVVALQQQLQQQQQAQNGVPATPQPAAPSGVPSTPLSSKPGSLSDGAPLGGPPSRNLTGLGSMARDTAAQAEMRAELEALKALLADVRKEVASEGGSLRREWQRAFSDMQSRYGEQTNELRAREQNIAKLREAAMMDEAERRAASNYEEKVGKRLTKLENGLEYLTHRLEVVEEQVSSLATSVAEHASPPVALSPAGLPPPGRLPTGRQDSQRTTPRSGPGPVSENRSTSAATFPPHLAVAAAATAASALVVAAGDPASLRGGRKWGPSELPMAANSGGGAEPCTGRYTVPGPDAQAWDGAGGCPRQTCSEQPSARSGVESLGGGSFQDPEEEEWWRSAHTGTTQMVTGRETLPPTTERSRYTPSVPSAGGAASEAASYGTSDSACVLTCRTSGRDTAGTGMGTAAATPGASEGGAVQERAPLVPPPLPAATATQAQQVSAGWSPGGCPAAFGQVQQLMHGHPCPPPLQQPGTMEHFSGVWPGSATPHAVGPVPPHGPGVAVAPGFLPVHISVPPAASTQHARMAGREPAAIDPASVALGPQLLPVAAQALLTPSMDIQRLAAAAAAAAVQQQQQQQEQQRQQLVMAQQELQVLRQRQQQQQQEQRVVGADRTDTMNSGPASPSGASPQQRSGPQKEPPTCFFCPLQ